MPEWHKTGHGLHAHFALGRFIKRSMIEAAWPHGFVSIKLLGNLPVGSTKLSEARIAGGYLAKYVAKSFADPVGRELGSHRYDVAEGFQPERVRFTGPSRDAVLEQASAHLGGSAPGVVWDSAESEQWPGRRRSGHSGGGDDGRDRSARCRRVGGADLSDAGGAGVRF